VLASSEVQVHITSRLGDSFYLVEQRRDENRKWEWRVRGQGPAPLVAVIHGYRGPIWFGQNSFSSGKTSAEDNGWVFRPGGALFAVNPHPHRLISTDAEFSASLSNRATLKFDR